MKLKWKIGNGILALLAIMVVVVVYLLISGRGGELTVANDELVKIDTGFDFKGIDFKIELPSNVDRLLNEMEFGAIAFNAPANVNIDESSQIQLILSLAETVEKLKQSIAKEGEKIGANIRVSDRMEARLSGYKFQITAITPEIQAVSKRQRTEWKWEIHPKEEGQHKLHLTLTALLEIDGHSTPRTIRTFSKIIEVNVTSSQKIGIFFKSNWQWLWAAILVPVAGWLWKRRKKQLTNTSS